MNARGINLVRVGAVSLSVMVVVGLGACAGDDSQSTLVAGVSTTSAVIDTTAPAAGSTSSGVGESTTSSAPPETAPPLRGLAYEPLASGLEFPVVLIPEPGSADHLVALKGGRVVRLTDSGEAAELLDISDRVRNEGEQGLLGVATHPDDASRIFLHYSDTSGDTVVSEFAVAADGTIDAASEAILFEASQPAGNHNGGWIQFGPDGALYLGLGDGGGANDQFGNGRDDDTMLAGLVRLGVDDGSAEKFAKGLRNPWRFWIDQDVVYVADVGQNAYEEVSVAPLTPGVDYGWSTMEANHCFPSGDDCDREGLLLPAIEVEHGDAGTCSITGGLVYRGSAIPELTGHYLYSDYCGGYLRSFRFADGSVTDATDWTETVGVPGQVVSFGHDAGGEVYVLTTSEILRLVPVR